jgi:hypothetical protein
MNDVELNVCTQGVYISVKPITVISILFHYKASFTVLKTWQAPVAVSLHFSAYQSNVNIESLISENLWKGEGTEQIFPSWTGLSHEIEMVYRWHEWKEHN